MDLNYNVESWDFSLRTMCLVSITRKVLEASRRDPTSTFEPSVIASRATERVQKLDLFPALNSEIENIIEPVMEEMLDWYTRYGDGVNVILTPHGTVDMIKSAKAFLRSNQSVYERYVVACDFCFQDEIFHLVEEASPYITYNENCTHPSRFAQVDSLAKFWHRVYDGCFDSRIGLEDLSAVETFQGYLWANKQSSNTSIKFFLKKASSSKKAIQLIFIRLLTTSVGYLPYTDLSPAAYGAFFNIKQVKEVQFAKKRITGLLLTALLKFPYQHLFMHVAKLLMENLSAKMFWFVAYMISQKIADGHKDYYYKGLFIAFWQMGSLFNKSDQQHFRRYYNQLILRNICLLRDEYLTSLVSDIIPAQDKI